MVVALQEIMMDWSLCAGLLVKGHACEILSHWHFCSALVCLTPVCFCDKLHFLHHERCCAWVAFCSCSFHRCSHTWVAGDCWMTKGGVTSCSFLLVLFYKRVPFILCSRDGLCGFMRMILLFLMHGRCLSLHVCVCAFAYCVEWNLLCACRVFDRSHTRFCMLCAFLAVGGTCWFLDVEVPYANKHIHHFFYTCVKRGEKERTKCAFVVCISICIIQTYPELSVSTHAFLCWKCC